MQRSTRQSGGVPQGTRSCRQGATQNHAAVLAGPASVVADAGPYGSRRLGIPTHEDLPRRGDMSVFDRHGIGRHRGRRRLTAGLAVVSATAAVIVLGAGPALAVHDEAFQLDGDVSAATTT